MPSIDFNMPDTAPNTNPLNKGGVMLGCCQSISHTLWNMAQQLKYKYYACKQFWAFEAPPLGDECGVDDVY